MSSKQLHCPSCDTTRITLDPFTGIYFCKQCGYQGTFIVEKKK